MSSSLSGTFSKRATVQFAREGGELVENPGGRSKDDVDLVGENVPLTNRKAAADTVSAGTLYEQLQKQKDAKEEENAKKAKAAFAPPKALDSDEVLFLEDQDRARMDKESKAEMQKQSDKIRYIEALEAAAGSKRKQEQDTSDIQFAAPVKQQKSKQNDLMKRILVSSSSSEPIATAGSGTSNSLQSMMAGYSDSDSD